MACFLLKDECENEANGHRVYLGRHASCMPLPYRVYLLKSQVQANNRYADYFDGGKKKTEKEKEKTKCMS